MPLKLKGLRSTIKEHEDLIGALCLMFVGIYGYLYQYYTNIVYIDNALYVDYSKISSAWILFQAIGFTIFFIKFLDLKAKMTIKEYIKLRINKKKGI